MTTPNTKKTLRAAASTVTLTPDEQNALLHDVQMVTPTDAERFLGQIENATFEVSTASEREGRLNKAVAAADTTFAIQGGDHNLCYVAYQCGRLFVAAVRKAGLPLTRADWSIDTRGGQKAYVRFYVVIREVSKANIEATKEQAEKLLTAALPGALTEGVKLARRALDATQAAREAEQAVREAAKAAVEAVEKAIDYKAKLAAIRNQREAAATLELTARAKFANLSAEAKALVTPEVRAQALKDALHEGFRLPSNKPLVTPTL